MPTYLARDIWNLPKDQIWGLPDGPMTLEFDDGVLETNARATIFSYYLGEYHRLYPETPLLREHHMGERQMTSDLHLDILGTAMWACIDAYQGRVDNEELCEIAYRVTNEIYNDFTSRLKSYVSVISILDFIEVMEHPEIKAANEEVKPTQLSIDQTYQRISQTLMALGELSRNTVARMAKSGLVSMGQIRQCVGPRGFLTDIDSGIFRFPILTGYVHGIRSHHDSMIESRSAAKALIFAKEPVAESEYFNREMQLVASTLARLHPGDCGSREYMPFRVRPGDLKKIEGKYYKDGDVERVVREEDRDRLNGKLIELRSALKCHHPDPYGVCQRCFGELGFAIPRETNLGHVCTTVMCEKISQNVLSTKHLDGSSTVDEFDVLSKDDKRFIRVGSDENTLKLAEGLKGKKVELTILGSQAENLSSIDYSDVDKLPVEQISSLRDVRIHVYHEDGTKEEPFIPVSMGTRYSSLTKEALHYIKRKGRRPSANGNYVVDLSDWDNELPLFQLPLKHTDMVQYMKTIKAFIMAAGKSGVPQQRTGKQKSLRDFATVEQALMAFYNLITSKLTVNIAHLEVIILSAMVRDEENFDHRLPRPISSGQLGSYGKNMENRSLAVTMAYERQAKKLVDVRSYRIVNRPDSPMDNLLLPYPVHNPLQ